MKRFFYFLLALCQLLCLTACNLGSNATQKEAEFYALVDSTQDIIDIVADDIYQHWYDCIYKDKYRESIDYAIAVALSDNEENINVIKSNTAKIKNLYKTVRDGKLSEEVKAVMQAYNDYYALVIEISGSFESYSEKMETCKKALSSSLSNLSFELD